MTIMRRASVTSKRYLLSTILHDFPQERFSPVGRDGELLESRPRFWLYIYFRYYRKKDGKLISGLRPFSGARPALRFISQHAGKNLIDDIYFVDSKERKSYNVYCDYSNIKLLPLQAAFDLQYE
nr:MAG TPA: hypothetical protein [Microviridae sp.]